MSDHGKGAVLVGDRLSERDSAAEHGTVDRIERHSPSVPGDTGFVLYLDETPEERELGPDDGVLVCLHCLIEHHPEAAAGLELAKTHPLVVFADGEWKPVEIEEETEK